MGREQQGVMRRIINPKRQPRRCPSDRRAQVGIAHAAQSRVNARVAKATCGLAFRPHQTAPLTIPHWLAGNSSTRIERRGSNPQLRCAFALRSREDWLVAEMQDYLNLAAEADDLAAWAPDFKLATGYHRLANWNQALARFHDRISTLLILCGEDRDS